MRTRGTGGLLLGTAWMSLWAATAAGQPFELVYGGGRDSRENAQEVKPVAVCSGGGFVAVGQATPPGIESRIYVVRLAGNGTTIWERSYNVNLNGFHSGWSIVELRDGSGFVITGNVFFERSGGDILLLKIGCEGSLRWAWTYDSISTDVRNEMGVQVIEAQTGDAASGTQPGDLLVSGITMTKFDFVNPLEVRPFLMRTRSNGLLIWNRRYTSLSAYFTGLAEARVAGGTGAADVVAAGVGREEGSSTSKGLVVRVSGNTGDVSASPQGAALYGGAEGTGFEAIVPLRVSPHAGELAMVGSTWEGGNRDITLVRTASDPTVLLAQRRIGEAGADHDDTGLDLREVLKATPLARAGDIALTGGTGPGFDSGAKGGADAFLLLADPATLEPRADTGRLYGDHATGGDWSNSVIVDPAGFTLAGASTSNFEGLQPPDPLDLYLVRTDASGHTSCDLPWRPPSHDPEFRLDAVTLTGEPFLRQASRNTIWIWVSDTRYQVCP